MTRQSRLPTVALPLLLWASAPAWATASLTCGANDRNLSLELFGNLGRGDGGSIQLIGGTLTLKAARGKFDATEFKIGSDHIAGQSSSARN